MDESLDGVDIGDLDEVLERVAAEAQKADRDADDAVPLHSVFDGHCRHQRANVNQGMRKLVCRDCDADLDPFDFVARLSSEAGKWRGIRIDLQNRARQAEERLERILRQERNARARLKRLQQKETNHERND